jgi:endo-1,4-beta-xylanase
MKVRRLAVIGLLVAATAVSAGGPATATPDQRPAGAAGSWDQQSLRTLAAGSGVGIGTAVNVSALAADEVYRRAVAREFSTVTAENAMKWESVEPERGRYDWTEAEELMAFAKRNRQRVRGHTLVWHNQLPAWLTSGSFTPAELRQILRKHIIDEASRFRGRIWQWDVVNEAFEEDGTLRDTIWLRALGPGYIADAFRWAHQADPKAKLYYNDYNIEGVNAKSDAVYELVKRLRREGVPIHGVGAQGHFALQYGFPADVAQNLQRFARLGVDTAITEADVRMPLPADTVKLQAQAQGYHVLLQACLLTPRCTSFTVWGFTDKYSWVPGWFEGEGAATLLDESFQPKPAYRAVQADFALAGRFPTRG